MRRKYYIEVLASPVGAPLCKYPIVRLRDWELPSLLALPADTPVSPDIVARLQAYVDGLNPRERAALIPEDVPLIGGVRSAPPPTTPPPTSGGGSGGVGASLA